MKFQNFEYKKHNISNTGTLLNNKNHIRWFEPLLFVIPNPIKDDSIPSPQHIDRSFMKVDIPFSISSYFLLISFKNPTSLLPQFL